MIRRPPRSTLSSSSAASDVYKRQVYNHIGPDGNYLPAFSSAYFTDSYHTPWGDAINFDGERSGPVREFFVTNAGYWIEEFHLDGLRMDAVHAIYDGSKEHVVNELTRRSRERAGDRSILVFIENEDQEADFARPPKHGTGAVDGLWNDDYHHAAKVALSDRGGAYYTDFRGSPQELISTSKFGYLFQGQPYVHTHGRRGSPALDLPPRSFVTYLDNHDQVANAGGGRRAHMLSDPGTLRALTAFLLLGSGTPLLFQGQEFAAASPFFFFADHNRELAPLVREGRAGFMTMFPPFSGVDGSAILPRPAAEPLLAPPLGTRWGVLWSSESPAYGGMGTPDPISSEGWWLPGRSALLFAPSS